jgi:hypothetical protein
MNNKNLSALVCGFAAAVLTVIPGVESFACCLIVPIASGFAVALFKKSNAEMNKIQTGTGVMLGLLTGIFAAIIAAVFEIILTLITKSNDLVAALPQTEQMINNMNLGPAAEEALGILRQMVNEIQSTGFSFIYSAIILVTNLITYTIFGMLGGVIGTVIINKRNATQN